MTAFNFNSYNLKSQQVCINSEDYTFTNAPVQMSGLFLFLVIPTFQSNNLQQIIIMTSSNIIYTRNYNGDTLTWGSWQTTIAAAATNYLGTYDASTNTPTLTDGTGTSGQWYLVTVAGTDNPTGVNIPVGHIIIYNGDTWEDGGSINSGGGNQALLTSATTINPGQSATITVTWLVAFTTSSYIANITASSTNDQPLLTNIVSGSKTTTNIGILVTNLGTLPVTSITLNLIGKVN